MAQPNLEVTLRYRKRTSVSSLKNPIALAVGVSNLVISMLVAGLGSGLASPALSQMAQHTLSNKELDQENTWINSGTSVGVILTGPVVLLFTEHWRLSYYFFAFIAVIVWIWNYLVIRSDQDKKSSARSQTKWLSAINKAKFLIAASLVIGISSSIYWTFSSSFITCIRCQLIFLSIRNRSIPGLSYCREHDRNDKLLV